MKESFETDLGTVSIDRSVIVRLAGMAALDCAGIVGMSSISKRDGVIKLLTRNSLSRGIKASVENGEIRLEFHIIVAFGVSINTITRNLYESVTYQVERATGLKVSEITVFVEGVRVID